MSAWMLGFVIQGPPSTAEFVKSPFGVFQRTSKRRVDFLGHAGCELKVIGFRNEQLVLDVLGAGAGGVFGGNERYRFGAHEGLHSVVRTDAEISAVVRWAKCGDAITACRLTNDSTVMLAWAEPSARLLVERVSSQGGIQWASSRGLCWV
jgi:hypothetical protein